MNNLPSRASNLVVFATVVQSGSITRGAARLGLERTTVSRRLRDFEKQLGAQLLTRSTKRIAVTDAGRVCYEHSLRVVRAAEDAVASARGDAVSVSLTIGASVIAIETLLRPALVDFQAEYPNTQVEFNVGDDWCPDNINSTDFIVYVGVAPKSSSSVVVQKVGLARQLIVASPEYMDAHNTREDCSELQQHDWIGYTNDNDLVSFGLNSQKSYFELNVIPKYRVPDMLTARQTAVAGLGICALPEFACRVALRRNELVPVSSRLEGLAVEIALIYKRAISLPHMSAEFADILSRSIDVDFSRRSSMMPISQERAGKAQPPLNSAAT